MKWTKKPLELLPLHTSVEMESSWGGETVILIMEISFALDGNVFSIEMIFNHLDKQISGWNRVLKNACL